MKTGKKLPHFSKHPIWISRVDPSIRTFAHSVIVHVERHATTCHVDVVRRTKTTKAPLSRNRRVRLLARVLTSSIEMVGSFARQTRHECHSARAVDGTAMTLIVRFSAASAADGKPRKRQFDMFREPVRTRLRDGNRRGWS